MLALKSNLSWAAHKNLRSACLILMAPLRLMMFSLNMVDYAISWTGLGLGLRVWGQALKIKLNYPIQPFRYFYASLRNEYYLWTTYLIHMSLHVFSLSIVRILLNGLISNFFKQCQASVKNSISTHSVFETNLVGCWNSLRLTCRNGHSFCSSLSTVLLQNKSSDPAFVVKYKTLETYF